MDCHFRVRPSESEIMACNQHGGKKNIFARETVFRKIVHDISETSTNVTLHSQQITTFNRQKIAA